jgi:hypothetical protein
MFLRKKTEIAAADDEAEERDSALEENAVFLASRKASRSSGLHRCLYLSRASAPSKLLPVLVDEGVLSYFLALRSATSAWTLSTMFRGAGA